MKNKKETPVIRKEYEDGFIVAGKEIFRTVLTTYENKDYLRLTIRFPDGSEESLFFSVKRTEVKGA